jgi:hypothetical protein
MGSETWLYLGIGIGAAVAAAVGLALVLRRRGGGGDWGRLAERYPAAAEPAGKLFTRHTVKVGRDVCRQCVTVVVADPGLYLRAGGVLGRRPPVLVPWDEFRDVTEGKLAFQKAAVLTVGRATTVTMPLRLYDRVRSHMPVPLRRRV